MATKAAGTPQAKLEKVAKATAFKRFSNAPAFKRSRRFPKLIPVQVPDWDVSETTVNDLARRLGGDRKLAAQIVSLQQKFPRGTVPELVFYTFLQKQGYSFEYQVEIMGGRRFEGGLVPDFAVFQDGGVSIFQIQGTFWHSLSKKGFSDQTNNLRMLGQLINGYTVKRVIEIWEDDIMNPAMRPQVFYLAMAGIPLRGIGSF